MNFPFVVLAKTRSPYDMCSNQKSAGIYIYLRIYRTCGHISTRALNAYDLKTYSKYL